MFKKLHDDWEEFKASPPGKRFQERFQRRREDGRKPLKKALYIGGGLAVIAAGVFMLAAPGPGLIGIAIGAGLIGQESLIAAKLLDRLEVALRPSAEVMIAAWRKASGGTKLALKGVALILAGGAALLSYQLFIR